MKCLNIMFIVILGSSVKLNFAQNSIVAPPKTEVPRAIAPMPDDLPPTEGEPNIDKIYFYEKMPENVNFTEVLTLIGYPKQAVKEGLEGTLIFRVLVDENGYYVRHRCPKVGNPIFIEAIEEHISKIKYSPAIYKNKPIKCWINLPFAFRMQ